MQTWISCIAYSRMGWKQNQKSRTVADEDKSFRKYADLWDWVSEQMGISNLVKIWIKSSSRRQRRQGDGLMCSEGKEIKLNTENHWEVGEVNVCDFQG